MLPETQGIHDREPLSISPFTDQANAEAFVRDHRQNLRYCHDSRRWFVWDGKVWRPDPDGEVMRRAKHTIQGLAAQMANADPEAAEAWAKHLQRSFQASRLRAIITLAQSEPGIPIAPNDFDRDPWLLNCQNGTVDLHTGELREHRQEDYCTKIVPAEFDAHAPCHKWKQFLKTITNGNEALTGFLQRVAGYALTGDTREQALFLLYGTGANGKSVFLDTLMDLLGGYGRQAAFSTFTSSKHGEHRPRNDLARLHGARFVSAVEMAEGKRFDEVAIKQLTGQDRISCRFLYHEHFEFKPQFKIFLAANHKPVIRGTDPGIWRRIRLIPFTVHFSAAQQDRTLSATLREELPGILAWAVRGCREWLDSGLGEPAEVTHATDSYRQEMDPLNDFFAARCLTGDAHQMPFKQLYEAYEQWCRDTDDTAISKKQFTQRLSERGLQPARIGRKQVRGWKGVALRPEVSNASADTSDGSRQVRESISPLTTEHLNRNGHLSAVSH